MKSKITLFIAFICSLILFIIGFRLISQSTDMGMDKAMLVLANYQNVQSDTTDIFGSFIHSAIWSYKIEGILLFLLGVVILFLVNPFRNK